MCGGVICFSEVETETMTARKRSASCEKAQHLLSPDVKCDAPSCILHKPKPQSGNILMMSRGKDKSLLTNIHKKGHLSKMKTTNQLS